MPYKIDLQYLAAQAIDLDVANHPDLTERFAQLYQLNALVAIAERIERLVNLATSALDAGVDKKFLIQALSQAEDSAEEALETQTDGNQHA